jgi:hypothetical protein
VPCINNVDNELPSYVTYSTKREATTGVDLNLEPEFLIGCDCTDDCQVRYTVVNSFIPLSVLTLCVTLACGV